MKIYELAPSDGRKSFYEKAMVTCYDSGLEVLRSYETNVIAKTSDGVYHRLWGEPDTAHKGWSTTTGRHIKAFSGLSRAEYMSYPYEGNSAYWKEIGVC